MVEITGVVVCISMVFKMKEYLPFCTELSTLYIEELLFTVLPRFEKRLSKAQIFDR